MQNINNIAHFDVFFNYQNFTMEYCIKLTLFGIKKLEVRFQKYFTIYFLTAANINIISTLCSCGKKLLMILSTNFSSLKPFAISNLLHGHYLEI